MSAAMPMRDTRSPGPAGSRPARRRSTGRRPPPGRTARSAASYRCDRCRPAWPPSAPCRATPPPCISGVGGQAATPGPPRLPERRRGRSRPARVSSSAPRPMSSEAAEARQEGRIQRGDDDAVERAAGIEQLAHELHRPAAGHAADDRLADEQRIARLVTCAAGNARRSAMLTRLPVAGAGCWRRCRRCDRRWRAAGSVRASGRCRAPRPRGRNAPGRCARATRSARMVVSIASMRAADVLLERMGQVAGVLRGTVQSRRVLLHQE